MARCPLTHRIRKHENLALRRPAEDASIQALPRLQQDELGTLWQLHSCWNLPVKTWEPHSLLCLNIQQAHLEMHPEKLMTVTT